jgi:hypothetical protein
MYGAKYPLLIRYFYFGSVKHFLDLSFISTKPFKILQRKVGNDYKRLFLPLLFVLFGRTPKTFGLLLFGTQPSLLLALLDVFGLRL